MKLIMEMKRMRGRCVSAAGCILSVLAALVLGGCPCDLREMGPLDKYILEVENLGDEELWMSVSYFCHDTELQESGQSAFYLPPHDCTGIYSRIMGRDEILVNCTKLQLLFLKGKGGERSGPDYDAPVVRRMEFTPSELEACDWFVVYE